MSKKGQYAQNFDVPAHPILSLVSLVLIYMTAFVAHGNNCVRKAFSNELPLLLSLNLKGHGANKNLL